MIFVVFLQNPILDRSEFHLILFETLFGQETLFGLFIDSISLIKAFLEESGLRLACILTFSVNDTKIYES